jgi:hypothetical protein
MSKSFLVPSETIPHRARIREPERSSATTHPFLAFDWLQKGNHDLSHFQHYPFVGLRKIHYSSNSRGGFVRSEQSPSCQFHCFLSEPQIPGLFLGSVALFLVFPFFMFGCHLRFRYLLLVEQTISEIACIPVLALAQKCSRSSPHRLLSLYLQIPVSVGRREKRSTSDGGDADGGRFRRISCFSKCI